MPRKSQPANGPGIKLIGFEHGGEKKPADPATVDHIKRLILRNTREGDKVALELPSYFVQQMQRLFPTMDLFSVQMHSAQSAFHDLLLFCLHNNRVPVALYSDFLSKRNYPELSILQDAVANALLAGKRVPRRFKRTVHKLEQQMVPVAEKFMLNRLIKEQPALAVIGTGHVDVLFDGLHSKGMLASIIHRDPLLNQHAKLLKHQRSIYARRPFWRKLRRARAKVNPVRWIKKRNLQNKPK